MRIPGEIITPSQYLDALKEIVGLDVEVIKTDRKRFEENKHTNLELYNK